ncbi:deoxyribose-phosphate aldolase [Candidatus Bathyarchaeota archaeon]|nr:MAG: deoxyribose-phosphate aldolase [Candidatus Bathyarchaeota archaeon]
MGVEPGELARRIDHAILKPDATFRDLEEGCEEARRLGLRGICVQPWLVEDARRLLRGSGVRVCSVVGFPFGYTLPDVKAREAEAVMELGADDVDMVMNISALRSGAYELVLEDIRGVVDVVKQHGGVVKAIIEVCYLTEDQIRKACEIAVRAGVDFVKTSTGFGPGGATVRAVELMRSVVGDRAGVKASGGIRTYEKAMAMLEAGADLIGTSTPGQVVGGALRSGGS